MQGGKHMNSERKLDFHAPLLSTRRPGRIIVPREKWDLDSSSDRVPFSWEQSPGKPKEACRKFVENKSNLANILPLKPPPIRIHQHSRDSSEDHHEEEDDDGCDGDVDEDADFFSGGLDLFSLAESSENVKDNRNERKVEKRGGIGRRRATPTPSFIMERFLPAAVALAAESLEEAEETGEVWTPMPSVTSPLGLKSCGLENLLRWRARPKKLLLKAQ